MENRPFLGELMTAEPGKPLPEALGEVDYAASFIQWFAEEARRANGEIMPPFKPGSRIFATREPVGVVAAIARWNFPMAMLTRKLGPALAAGCTAIVKPAAETPLCANALLALADAAGVPPGVLNGVCGDTHAISDAIMASSDVRKITFTGSTAVGKTLVAHAAATMKHVSMELGGNAPLIVFDDADIKAAVAGTIANKFRNAGQVCVAINRIYVHDNIYDEYVAKLGEAIARLTVGDGMTPGVAVGPLIDERRGWKKVERHVFDALGKEAELVTGGKRSPLRRYLLRTDPAFALLGRHRSSRTRKHSGRWPPASGSNRKRKSSTGPTTPRSDWPPTSTRKTSPASSASHKPLKPA